MILAKRMSVSLIFDDELLDFCWPDDEVETVVVGIGAFRGFGFNFGFDDDERDLFLLLLLDDVVAKGFLLAKDICADLCAKIHVYLSFRSYMTIFDRF